MMRGVVGLLLLVAFGAGGAWLWLDRQTRFFSLQLDVKTPQGERQIRVVGTDVTLEERERQGGAVTHNCGMDLLDFYAFRKLVRATLTERELDKKARAGTFAVTLGDDDPQNGNGDLDAAQVTALSDFLVKGLRGCVDRTQRL